MFWFSLDFCIENSKICLNIRVYVLFFKCKGLICVLLINLLIFGLNFCFDFFLVIKEVILFFFVFLVNFDLFNFFFSFLICLIIFICVL